jgi:hypothetical protein
MIRSYYAGATVNPYRFVVQDSADNTVIQASANTSKIMGISGQLARATGQSVDVASIELTKCELGGTVTRGDLLTSDADGKGIELSSAILASASARCGAVALQSGVSGDIIDVVQLSQLVSAFDGVTATVDEIDQVASMPVDADFTIGDEDANVINVAVQLNDANGDECAVRRTIYAYLSDDANGDSIVATAPDGGVAIGTDGLADPITAGKSFMLTSEADGDIDINITHAGGADTFYLILVMPNGALVASAAITFA